MKINVQTSSYDIDKKMPFNQIAAGSIFMLPNAPGEFLVKTYWKNSCPTTDAVRLSDGVLHLVDGHVKVIPVTLITSQTTEGVT